MSAFGTLAVTVWAVAESGTWARLVIAADAVAWFLVALGLFTLRRGLILWAVGLLGVGAAFALGLHATVVEAAGWGAVLLGIAEFGLWSIDRVSAIDDRAGQTRGRWLGEGVLIGGAFLVTVVALLIGTQIGAAGSAVETVGGLALIGISALLLMALRHQHR